VAFEPSHSFAIYRWGVLMEAVDNDLILIQDDIRKSFGWDVKSDLESATQLVAECKNPPASVRFNSRVTVVGAAASPNTKTTYPTIVADGAVGAVADLSSVALIVTDGDGTPYLEQALNIGIPICLHAHGDNVESWKRVLSLIDSNQEVILTHQTPYSIEGMYNPGGFTDGDRAVCVALALGASEVELIGYSTKTVGQWSGTTDEKRKLIKLGWMKKILNILSLRVNDEG